MDRETLAAAIDHTVLGPETSRADVRRVLSEAATHGMNACIPPCYLSEAGREPEVTVCTVAGFPHGQHAPEVKAAEAERAWRAGADEIDLVCNVGRLQAGEHDAVRAGIERVVGAVPVPVKVIVEAGLLDDEALHSACKLAKEAGADYVKTSTGFAGGPAAVDDVELMSDYLPVKASGGVGDYERAAAMFEAGAERIGASSGVAIVESYPD